MCNTYSCSGHLCIVQCTHVIPRVYLASPPQLELAAAAPAPSYMYCFYYIMLVLSACTHLLLDVGLFNIGHQVLLRKF